MSCLAKQTTFIPCEPFEADVFDITSCRVIKARIVGYEVAIRSMEDPHLKSLLKPIDLARNDAKHGIIAAPKWEEIEVTENKE